jgi:hypothetical protein
LLLLVDLYASHKDTKLCLTSTGHWLAFACSCFFAAVDSRQQQLQPGCAQLKAAAAAGLHCMLWEYITCTAPHKQCLKTLQTGRQILHAILQIHSSVEKVTSKASANEQATTFLKQRQFRPQLITTSSCEQQSHDAGRPGEPTVDNYRDDPFSTTIEQTF